ncbi:hypothetical protein [Thomasclavelia spiroformis]|uniref:hypothetical protein n=1 Tax=Thomasclavelia spiroformis TaxID=29348 RepID=UPI0039A3CC6C
MYEKLKEYMENGYYTIVQAQSIINNMYAQKQLSDDEYNELFEMSKTLEANNVDDALNAQFNVINEHLKKLDEEIANLKQAIEDGGSTVPPLEEADGTEFNPIEAYSGLYYKAGLYYFEYKNKNQKEVYKCRDLEDTQGDGKQLYDLPSELINVYFDWVRKDNI